MALRSIMRDYFWRKTGRKLTENVNNVKKFYRISLVNLDNTCQHTDKEILIEYDEACKHKDEKQQPPSQGYCLGEFTDVINRKRELYDLK